MCGGVLDALSDAESECTVDVLGRDVGRLGAPPHARSAARVRPLGVTVLPSVHSLPTVHGRYVGSLFSSLPTRWVGGTFVHPPVRLLLIVLHTDQVADILVEQLGMQSVARLFRRWLLHLGSLVPASQGDWLEFRRTVVHLLPDFRAYFSLVTSDGSTADDSNADKQTKKLMRATNERVSAFEKARRRHLFGHDKLQRSGGGDPIDAIAGGDLSRSCLLLVVAGFLASFNPQDTDAHFLSSSGGVRRTKRAKKSGQPSASAAAQINQLLVGPRIFTLQRLLAIYLNLRAEATADLYDEFTTVEAREDIFLHVRVVLLCVLTKGSNEESVADVSASLVCSASLAARDARADAALPAHVAAQHAGRHQVPVPRRLAVRARDCPVLELPARVVSQHGVLEERESGQRTMSLPTTRSVSLCLVA